MEHRCADVDACWREFWFPVLQCEALYCVQQELFDYHGLIIAVSEVYDNVTGGLISKPNTAPFEVINAASDLVDKAYGAGYDAGVEDAKAEVAV